MLGYKDIPNYEGLYAVNDYGMVWSYRSNRHLVSKLTPSGYHNIGLRVKGDRKWFLIHRLVGSLFVDNPENKQYINHKDCNKINNKADNLEWVTASENMKHAQRHGLVNTKEQQERIRSACGYLTMGQAEEIRSLHKAKSLTQQKLGDMYGVSCDVVYHILKGNTYCELGGIT